MSSEKKADRWWIWTYKGKFMRATNDLRGWDGVTLSERDVITEVYGADYVSELTQERDADVLRMQKATEMIETLTATCNDLRQKLWDWNGQFETQEARLEAITAERDELKRQLEGSLAMYDIRLHKFDAITAERDRLRKQVEELTDTCSKEAHEQER